MNAPVTAAPPIPKRKRGCLFYGCLGSIIVVVVIVVAGYLGFRYAVERFTDDKPLPLPTTQYSAEDAARLRERIASFSKAVEQNQPAGPLSLTTDEANVLIQSDPHWSFLKGQMYVAFESNLFKAQISVPAEKLGSKRLRGRYLNASGTFNLSFRDGRLQVGAEELSAKGQPVPENVMQQLRRHNFAASFTNAEVNAALDKLQEIQIREGKLIIVPKQNK